ncbi:MAG: DNA/RNA nuclease SfsA [Thermofilaceae archaeon]
MLLDLPPAVEGRIIRRVNRFVVEVVVGGLVERAYINNTGRLSELLVTGRKCYCLPKSGGLTSLRLIAVDDGVGAALIDTAIQMKAFEKALQARALPWAPCSIISRNPRLGRSVLDYLLDCRGEPVYVELKSAVLRDGFYAAYPDCPTARGRRHVIELAEYAERGGKSLIVFIAALRGVRAFRPYEKGDPEMPNLLRRAASAGVEIRALSMHYDPASSLVVLDNPDLPVIL